MLIGELYGHYIWWYCIAMIHEEIQSTQNIYHISIAKQKKVRVDRIIAFIVDDDETQMQIGIVVVLTSLAMGRYRRTPIHKRRF